MKKKIIGLLLILMAFTFQLSAQGNNGGKGGRKPFDRDAFFSKRNAYITEKVGLSAKEASVFIPLDNELISKKFETGRACHKLERELRNKKDRTDEECQALLKCREEAKAKSAQLDKEYLEKFKKILSSEQIVKYQNADKDFFDEFMRSRQK